MSFAEALAAATPVPSGGQCKVGKWAATLSPADREEFNAALNSHLDSATIHRAATSMGANVAASTFNKHRRNECVCTL